MSSKKTILVFTGGGLAPALNASLYGVITEARLRGYRILGGVAGWKSLLPGGHIIDVTDVNVESIKDIGGTFLRSSRINPFASPENLRSLKEKIAAESITAIIGIGGNDTLGALKRCVEEEQIPAVGIPKTIDNDLSGTYWTPGFPSAAHYISTFVKEIREDAAYALSRVYVIEALGMHSGWLAASSCYGQSDVIIPPEHVASLRHVLDLTHKRYRDNGEFAVVVVAQECRFDEPLKVAADTQADHYGVKRQMFVAMSLRDKIEQELGLTARMLYPGNYFETGMPIPIDREYATQLGQYAVRLVEEKKFGQMSCLIRPDAVKTTLEVRSINLSEVVGEDKLRKLEDGMFDYQEFRATQKFYQYLEPALGKFSPPDSGYYTLLDKVRK